MMIEVTTFATVLKPVVTAVAPRLLKTVQSKLNPTELERALQEGLDAAHQQEQEQAEGERLFSKYEPDFIPKFLCQFFEDSSVQAELQKPLKNEGTPDDALLARIFERIAEQKGINLVQARVMPWIRMFTSTYFEQTSSYLRFQIAKEKYFEHLIRCFDDVRFGGIAVEGQEIERSEKLVEIFVMPDVKEKAKTEFDILEQDLPLDVKSNTQTRLIRKQRSRSRLIHNQLGKQRFSAAKLLHKTKARRLVLLGIPGSGKTTLMSYFGVQLARQYPNELGLDESIDWLPILIKIRDLVKQPEINILKYARHMVEEDWGMQSLPLGFFEYWLKDGKTKRALILLDGLDEVAEEAKRYKVVERIENFLGAYEQSYAIITSRPAGYKPDFFRTDEFPHYEVLPFDDEQIRRFIDHWYDSRFATKAEAERRKKSLNKALSENNRIKLLARNPLLLTIIALIHRYQAVLPKERHKLYDKAVDTLLTSWDANKELSNHEVLEYLELDDLRRLMEQLAYWIHSQGGTGGNEGGTLIDREELINQLTQYIKEVKRIKRYCAKAEAERFLDQIVRDRAGLLSQQGHNQYAFVHKTFQEYLAAQEIHDRKEDDFEVVLEHIREHLHDPHWQEVLLLLIAQQRRSNPAKVLREILNQPTPHEEWLHRNLFFAGQCLAENIDVTDENLVENILERLIALEITSSPLISFSIRTQVFQVLCRLRETRYEAEVLHRLKFLSNQQVGKVRLQKYRFALGEQDEAVSELILLLKHESAEVRSDAASTVSWLENSSEVVVNVLLPLLNDESEEVRSSAASALGWLENSSEVVVNALLSLLKDESKRVRSSAALALGRLENSAEISEVLVNALLLLLRDESEEVRFESAFALSRLENSSEVVVNVLLPLLKDESEKVRSSAAFALGRLENSSEVVVNTLLPLLKDKSEEVRSSAASALGWLENSSEVVVNALLPLLNDENEEVRSSAASTLGRLENSSEVVVNTLLSLLKDESNRVRLGAASALVSLENSSEVVVNTLLSLLRDESNGVHFGAAFALGRLENSSEVVVNALLPLLKDESEEVRSSAAFALGRLENSSEVVVNALLPLLKDKSEKVRSSAASALRTFSEVSGSADSTKYIASALEQWIEQNQLFEGVGKGIDVLWDMMSEAT